MIVDNNLIKFLGYCYERDEKEIPQGWGVVLDAKQLGQNLYGFEAVAFLNKELKQVVIAHNGTNLVIESLKSLYQDLYLWTDIYKQEIPFQFKQGGVNFINMLMSKLESQGIQGFELINIGHSTGGVLSELSTVYVNKLGIQAACVSFENPGSKPIIEKYAQEVGVELQKIEHRFKVINAEESMLNELNPHFGKVLRIDAPYDNQSSFLSKTVYTLGQIGELLSIAHKVYSLYVNFEHHIVAEAHSNEQLQTGLTCLNAANMIKALSVGLLAAGEKATALDKAIFMHKYENIKKFIEQYNAGSPESTLCDVKGFKIFDIDGEYCEDMIGLHMV